MSESNTSINVPEKPSLTGLEEKFSAKWQENGVYTFNKDTSREEVYSIDTPPPTASGSLHVGHMFSFTHTDVIARFQRMTGKNVFYPMGWDDNGLPTERRVQNYYGVRCEPSVPYEENLELSEKPPKNDRDFKRISRRNFIELCHKLTVEDEKVFEKLFRTLGLSVDWDLSYRTIDDHSRKVSQYAFLKELKNGRAYSSEAPTMWDVTFQTAVAQAELEDKEVPGAYHRIPFTTDDGNDIFIETTRPELLPACVALVAHPDDDRYKDLFGKTVKSPLFEVEVPVKAHELAKPDKGSGIAMICTFGDLTDVTWWRELQLPTRPIVGRDGRIIVETPAWITSKTGREVYEQMARKTIFSAKATIVDALKENNLLDGEPKKITHPVNFYEKGSKPLEIVTTRQWYLANGGRDEKLKKQLIERGRELNWYPDYMRYRYENWVEGLNGDWLVSRQRYFGVAIPLWYPLNNEGEPDYDNPILPETKQLPVDPASEAPKGYEEDQRNQPNGFMADPDILDTWATSSLTPQVVGGWKENEEQFANVFPFDLRPQGHDIIRTWLFSTMVRANSLNDSIPFKNAALSGWILDPDRKKMSKSKGNVVVPDDVIEKFGTDAVRYWAASAKLGADTAFEERQMKIGRRLAIKLLNASKFALNLDANASHLDSLDKITDPLDKSLLANLGVVIEQATKAFETNDYARALHTIEPFFWSFTDDYIELVKNRANGNQSEEGKKSAAIALSFAIDGFLRLFAPFMPFTTDEVWSWWRTGSVHAQEWPKADKLADFDKAEFNTASEAIAELRRAKSEEKIKQRNELTSVTLEVPEARKKSFEKIIEDLKATAKVIKLNVNFVAGDEYQASDLVPADIES
ncbi:MAG: valine--tRNA ligase [Micrococcaceae bacterium]